MTEAVVVADAALAHLRWRPADAGGPAGLVVDGGGGGRHGWGPIGQALAQAGHDALAVDLPGYGLSPAIRPYDLAGLAAAVQRQIDELGQGPAVLVGHSMGGMVAQEVAARAPSCVAALVLAGTSPAFGKPDGDWQRGFVASRCAPLDAGIGMAGLAAQLVPTMVASGLAGDRLAAAVALMSAVPEATYRDAVAALVAFDRRADLARLAVPTLVATGEHDRTAPPLVAQRMAERIAGARLAIVPGAGHLLPIEAPQAFGALLLAFLSRHFPGGGAAPRRSAEATGMRPPSPD